MMLIRNEAAQRNPRIVKNELKSLARCLLRRKIGLRNHERYTAYRALFLRSRRASRINISSSAGPPSYDRSIAFCVAHRRLAATVGLQALAPLIVPAADVQEDTGAIDSRGMRQIKVATAKVKADRFLELN
jgi:hypothetical protein